MKTKKPNFKLTESQEYFLEQIEEWIYNSFKRDLDLSLEEEEQLTRELRARIYNYFN